MRSLLNACIMCRLTSGSMASSVPLMHPFRQKPPQWLALLPAVHAMVLSLPGPALTHLSSSVTVARRSTVTP